MKNKKSFTGGFTKQCQKSCNTTTEYRVFRFLIILLFVKVRETFNQ